MQHVRRQCLIPRRQHAPDYGWVGSGDSNTTWTAQNAEECRVAASARLVESLAPFLIVASERVFFSYACTWRYVLEGGIIPCPEGVECGMLLCMIVYLRDRAASKVEWGNLTLPNDSQSSSIVPTNAPTNAPTIAPTASSQPSTLSVVIRAKWVRGLCCVHRSGSPRSRYFGLVWHACMVQSAHMHGAFGESKQPSWCRRVQWRVPGT